MKRVGVIVFPGTTCDWDAYQVYKDILKVDVKYVWHNDTFIDDIDIIFIPGGFSYGDYLRAGAIAHLSPVMTTVKKLVLENKIKVIGICNGFQILLECKLLPGTLIVNKNINFICKQVNLKVIEKNTAFTRFDKSIVQIPIAHKYGNYFIDEPGLKDLEKNNQIIFKYSDCDGNINETTNPNGSVSNIAGIINKQGNVLGMMPHPERACESLLGSDDGLLILRSMLNDTKFDSSFSHDLRE